MDLRQGLASGSLEPLIDGDNLAVGMSVLSLENRIDG
jgi:hypothetical protein